MQDKDNTQAGFVERLLPWIVTLAALVVYLITLNHWVTLSSLPVVAKVTGWDWWSLSLQAPLFYVLTLPFRWLPMTWQPVALNVFAAICAAGALGFLAHAVALLPHDRTRDQRQRELSEYSILSIPAAWLPPVFAVLACGFQLTFWEHATAATGESLNLLLFAYVIHCLLAYRVDSLDSRLYRMAFAYGLAVTNNYGAIPFGLPLLTAVIWIQGFRFFRLAFILRLLGYGVLGLSLYLLLPLVAKSGNGADMSLWQLVKSELGMQKSVLFSFPSYVILICSLTSLLPAFVIGFRWPSSFGDVSIVGSVLTNFMFRVVHGLFLVVCVWVLFDPSWGPRALGFGMPFLSLHFLSALCVGYYSGYFLLVCGAEPQRRRHHTPAGVQFLNRVIVVVVWLALIAVPAGLVHKNWPRMQANNGPHLHRLAGDMARCLPANGSIALSDEPFQLLLVEAALASAGVRHDHLLLDTKSLPYPVYQASLQKRYPGRWPNLMAGQPSEYSVDRLRLLLCVSSIASTNPNVFFLNPPINYYSEGMYAQPHGLVYQMSPYSTGVVLNPIPGSNVLAFNQSFWVNSKTALDTMPKPLPKNEREAIIDDAGFAMSLYSRAVNHWGVELQKLGRFSDASNCFVMAQEFNPDNLVARVNAEYNQNLAKGQSRSLEVNPVLEGKIKQQYRRLEDCLYANGGFDEPRYCQETGQTFATARPVLIRQAAQQFLRVQALDPGNLAAPVWLANLYLKWPWPEKTMEVTQQMEAQQDRFPLSLEYQIEIVRLKAWAYVSMTNVPAAVKLLQEARQRNPTIASLPETLSQIYLSAKQFSNSLAALDEQLRLNPKDVNALFNKGSLSIQLTNYADAIPPFTEILKSDSKHNAARLNRAIAYLRSGQLDAAKADYETLKELLTASELYQVYYGLGEIAYRQKDVKKAITNYELYLQFLPRNSKNGPADPDLENVLPIITNRVRELKSGGVKQ